MKKERKKYDKRKIKNVNLEKIYEKNNENYEVQYIIKTIIS